MTGISKQSSSWLRRSSDGRVMKAVAAYMVNRDWRTEEGAANNRKRVLDCFYAFGKPIVQKITIPSEEKPETILGHISPAEYEGVIHNGIHIVFVLGTPVMNLGRSKSTIEMFNDPKAAEMAFVEGLAAEPGLARGQHKHFTNVPELSPYAKMRKPRDLPPATRVIGSPTAHALRWAKQGAEVERGRHGNWTGQFDPPRPEFQPVSLAPSDAEPTGYEDDREELEQIKAIQGDEPFRSACPVEPPKLDVPGMPTGYSWDAVDWDRFPTQVLRPLRKFRSASLRSRPGSLVLFGPTSSGKTMLAAGLGAIVVNHGLRVAFIDCADQETLTAWKSPEPTMFAGLDSASLVLVDGIDRLDPEGHLRLLCHLADAPTRQALLLTTGVALNRLESVVETVARFVLNGGSPISLTDAPRTSERAAA